MRDLKDSPLVCVWIAVYLIGLYFAAAPLAIVLASCLILSIYRIQLADLIAIRTSSMHVALVVLVLFLGFSYVLSVMVNFDSVNYKLFYSLAYGPLLVVIFAAGFLMQKNHSKTLQIREIALLLAFQLVFIFYLGSGPIIREISVGQLILLPMAFTMRAVGWRNVVPIFFILFSGVIASFSDQRVFLVATVFELIALNLLFFGRRSLVLSIVFGVGFFVGGVAYVQSVTGNGLSSLSVPAISKRVVNDPRQFGEQANSLLSNYSDRLQLYAVTFDVVKAHSFFGFSKQIPYDETIMGSRAPVVEMYKQINYAPTHPHNFLLKAYYDLGWQALIYIVFFGFLIFWFFVFGWSALSISLISVFGVYGLVESPTPFCLFFLVGILAARSVNLKGNSICNERLCHDF